jgi:hypothetical protein
MALNYAKLHEIFLDGYKDYPEMFKLLDKDKNQEDYELEEVDRAAYERNATYATLNLMRDLSRIPELRKYLQENL